MTRNEGDATECTGSQPTAGRREVLTAAGGLPLASRVAQALADDPPPEAVGTGDLTRGDPAASGDADYSVFPQGVASGDPTPTGAVVWTRVAPDAYRRDEPLRLTVAEDASFEQPVGSWRIPSEAFGPDCDHTVTVDLVEGVVPVDVGGIAAEVAAGILFAPDALVTAEGAETDTAESTETGTAEATETAVEETAMETETAEITETATE